MTPTLDDVLGAHLVIVTGKGGVGKTTVAASMALVGVASGRRTLLVEVEGRQGIARALGTAPLVYEERELRPGLSAAAIDPTDAVLEYLELFYGLGRMQRVMERSSALEFVTTAAPGLRDLLLVGKLYELETRRRPDGRRVHDLIVVDAPPTGRIVPFLSAPSAVTEIVRVGPIRRQAAQIEELLTDPARARAVMVTLLEELPVTEALEGRAALDAAGIAVAPIVANRVEHARLDAVALATLERLGPDGLAERAGGAGAPLSASLARLALDLARDQHERADLEAALLDQLHAASGPVVRLPLLATATLGADELDLLAHLLDRTLGSAATPPPHGIDAADLSHLLTSIGRAG
ncbi:MAG: hypothetical protein RLZZ272_1005 [Actinomycetota bacterium]